MSADLLQLEARLRAMLDPDKRTRKTIPELVSALLTSQRDAWKQCERLQAEVDTLRPRTRQAFGEAGMAGDTRGT